MVEAGRLSGSIGRARKYLSRRLHSRRGRSVHFISEGNDWVIDKEGLTLQRRLEGRMPVRLQASPRGLRNQIVHFGSIWSLVGNLRASHASNLNVLTWYHGHEGMGPEMRAAIGTFQASIDRLDAVVTACTDMRQRLSGWGVPREKLHLIPLGVKLEAYRAPAPHERARTRQALGIPDEALCIGSFQKDGSGWGEGLEPKLIKGPDRFVRVVERVAKKHRVHVLLLGPSRGFVKRGLEAAGVPFTHVNAASEDVPRHYQALDLYLVTSREEGGPRSLPEAMACGVPLVTTRVGMAPDMVRHGVNGLLVHAASEEQLLQSLEDDALRLLRNPALRRRLATGGLETARAFDERTLADRYYNEVYQPLLA